MKSFLVGWWGLGIYLTSAEEQPVSEFCIFKKALSIVAVSIVVLIVSTVQLMIHISIEDSQHLSSLAWNLSEYDDLMEIKLGKWSLECTEFFPAKGAAALQALCLLCL